MNNNIFTLNLGDSIKREVSTPPRPTAAHARRPSPPPAPRRATRLVRNPFARLSVSNNANGNAHRSGRTENNQEPAPRALVFPEQSAQTRPVGTVLHTKITTVVKDTTTRIVETTTTTEIVYRAPDGELRRQTAVKRDVDEIEEVNTNTTVTNQPAK